MARNDCKVVQLIAIGNMNQSHSDCISYLHYNSIVDRLDYNVYSIAFPLNQDMQQDNFRYDWYEQSTWIFPLHTYW